MLRFGELLDLIDSDRESEETICIMGLDGEPEMQGKLCSMLWKPFENMTVNSIQSGGVDIMNVWIQGRIKEDE